MLIELIAKNAGQSQEDRPYYPSPSKVGHCQRALTYHAIGVPPQKLPDRTLLVFEDGNRIEEEIKDHIRRTIYTLTEWKGPKQRVQIATINGRVMDGEVDGMLSDPLGIIRMLEIKSINHFSFERLDKDPLPEHTRQANLYLHGLNEAGMDVKEALIIYKNKNTSAMKEFIVTYDRGLALADIALFEQIDAWAKSNTVPPRPYDRDEDWQCGYCRWSEFCYKGYEKEFEDLAENVELEDDIVTLLKYYLEVAGQRKNAEKEEEALKAKIKTFLKEKKVKSGSAGTYTVKLTMTERKNLDKSLIPDDVLLRATTKKPSEKLTIRKVEEKDGVHDNKKQSRKTHDSAPKDGENSPREKA